MKQLGSVDVKSYHRELRFGPPGSGGATWLSIDNEGPSFMDRHRKIAIVVILCSAFGCVSHISNQVDNVRLRQDLCL